jgi:hypothetical protein
MKRFVQLGPAISSAGMHRQSKPNVVSEKRKQRFWRKIKDWLMEPIPFPGKTCGSNQSLKRPKQKPVSVQPRVYDLDRGRS